MLNMCDLVSASQRYLFNSYVFHILSAGLTGLLSHRLSTLLISYSLVSSLFWFFKAGQLTVRPDLHLWRAMGWNSFSFTLRSLNRLRWRLTVENEHFVAECSETKPEVWYYWHVLIQGGNMKIMGYFKEIDSVFLRSYLVMLSLKQAVQLGIDLSMLKYWSCCFDASLLC